MFPIEIFILIASYCDFDGMIFIINNHIKERAVTFIQTFGLRLLEELTKKITDASVFIFGGFPRSLILEEKINDIDLMICHGMSDSKILSTINSFFSKYGIQLAQICKNTYEKILLSFEIYSIKVDIIVSNTRVIDFDVNSLSIVYSKHKLNNKFNVEDNYYYVAAYDFCAQIDDEYTTNIMNNIKSRTAIILDLIDDTYKFYYRTIKLFQHYLSFAYFIQKYIFVKI